MPVVELAIRAGKTDGSQVRVALRVVKRVPPALTVTISILRSATQVIIIFYDKSGTNIIMAKLIIIHR